MPEFTNLFETVSWLGVAGAAWWMYWWSKTFYLLRHPDFEKPFKPPVDWLSEKAQQLTDIGSLVVVTLGSFAVPALATLVATKVPADWWATLQPYYSYAVGLILIYLAQQGYHDFRPKF